MAPHHPAVAKELAKAEDLQVRLADLITRFAGSMPFVYVHVALFAIWMLFWEDSPWPSLTLVVSLEAIFLSTFVMIGQNRQARFQRAKADHDFLSEEQELRLNTDLTRTIERLVRQIHATVQDGVTPGPTAAVSPQDPALLTRTTFEQSGHTPPYDEPANFAQVVTRIAGTAPRDPS